LAAVTANKKKLLFFIFIFIDNCNKKNDAKRKQRQARPIKPSVAYFRAYCKDRYILRKNTRFTFFKHSGTSPATDYTLKKYFLISLFIPYTSFNFAWCKFA